jgi:Domain of unknown function (DUF4190)
MQPPSAPHAGRPPLPPANETYPSLPYNPWAIVSIAFAASTVIGTWCLGGLIAVITGHVARQQIKRSGEAGANVALVGLIVGYVAIGLTVLFIAVYVAFFALFIAFAAHHPTPTPGPTASP